MWLKALGFFLLSSIKFAVASPLIAASYSFSYAWIILVSGGIFGNFFFLYVWEHILNIWNVYIIKKGVKEKAIKVNKSRRKIIKIKNSYGYWGIVILTPVFVSIPIGAFLLVQYYKTKRYKFLHLCISVTFWATIYISFFQFFGNIFI